MGKGQPGSALRTLRALFAAGTSTGLTDGQLLERYAAGRAESAEAATGAEMAFAALLDRHGPMVWGVCRRVLGDAHAAEDAFQATFLVLIRKAGSVRVEDSLGRWLYGVAHRVALRARAEADRRAAGIDRVPPASVDDPAGVAERGELRDAVGEELDRLPLKYRCPIELCHLQGMTYDQAARQLDWPVATVKNRLVEGRLRLRRRLERRGLAPVALGVAAALGGEARAAVPRALVRATARAAAGASVAFPTTVMNLTEGVLRMILWEKLKLVAAGAVVAVGLTARALSQQAAGGDPGTGPRQATASTAEKRSGDRRWVRTVPCGALIEVVGLSSFPPGPDTWWRPDGTPLDRVPCDPDGSRVSGDRGTPKQIVVRLARIPEGAEHHWGIVEAMGNSSGPARRGGEPLPGLHEMTALLPAEAETGTIRFQVAAGPWKTVQTWGKNQGAVGGILMSFIFSGAIATKEGTAVAVTHDIKGQSVRLVAIDVDGQEVPGKVRAGSGAKNFRQIVIEFAQPPDQIKEFRLQVRPYEVVELPGVALKRK